MSQGSRTATLVLPSLRPYQLPVFNSQAVDDVTVSAPQLGKTTTGLFWLLSSAWEHGRDSRPWWIASPTYAQARYAMRQLATVARSAGVLASSTNTPPLQAELVNGALIEGRSWDNPAGMYGTSVLGGVVDEFGQLTEQAYSAISSRRAETIGEGFGRFRYLGNVGDIGGAGEKIWNDAEAGKDGFACRRWTWLDRARAHVCVCDVAEPELGTGDRHAPTCERGIYVQFIEREAERMSAVQFRTLYLAEWADWNELPVYEFDRAVHAAVPIAHQPSLELDIACDFNVDPMAWCVGQHKADEAWALAEISIPGGATTEQACREVIRRYPDRKQHVVVYGDASGTARKTSASRTDYQIIQDVLGGHYHGLRMCVPNSNPPVADRVNAFNAMLRSATGHVRYTIDPQCKGLVNDLARVSWRPGTRDIDKRNKKLTHFSDADGYRLAWLFPVRGVAYVSTATAEGSPLLPVTF